MLNRLCPFFFLLWSLWLVNSYWLTYRRFLWSVTFWLLYEGTKKSCAFPLNRGVPSIEVTNTKITWTFFRDYILCPLDGGVPSVAWVTNTKIIWKFFWDQILCPLNWGVPKERFHCRNRFVTCTLPGSFALRPYFRTFLAPFPCPRVRSSNRSCLVMMLNLNRNAWWLSAGGKRRSHCYQLFCGLFCLQSASKPKAWFLYANDDVFLIRDLFRWHEKTAGGALSPWHRFSPVVVDMSRLWDISVKGKHWNSRWRTFYSAFYIFWG